MQLLIKIQKEYLDLDNFYFKKKYNKIILLH